MRRRELIVWSKNGRAKRSDRTGKETVDELLFDMMWNKNEIRNQKAANVDDVDDR